MYVFQETFLVVAYAMLFLMWNKRRKICREPSYESLEIREKYLPGYDSTSINMVHMSKIVVFNLCSILCDKGLMHDTLHLSMKKQLLMFTLKDIASATMLLYTIS